MPRIEKNKIVVKKPKKQKLGPAERSQIAKDRWAKIMVKRAERRAKAEASQITVTPYPAIRLDLLDPIPAPPTVEQEPVVQVPEPIPVAATVAAPAPQLAPVKVPKQKRYTGPKEFSVALKAAEIRLAKAINERAEAMGKLAGLNAEIPSLLQIINALKGPSNVSPVPYDMSGSVPNAAMFQTPLAPQFEIHHNPLAAVQAAMTPPPVSRASGGAIQFAPDVLGSLEGPEDDDVDKFITGPAAGGSGWIGG